MRNTVLTLAILILTAARGSLSAAQFPTLRDLDKVVAEQQKYADIHEREIAQTKRAIANAKDLETRYKETGILSHQFSSYRVDSALYYGQEALRIAERLGNPRYIVSSKLVIVGTLIHISMYKEAEDIINSIDRQKISPDDHDLLNQYYLACNTLYDALKEYAIDGKRAEQYRVIAKAYKDSILMCGPDNPLIRADILLNEGKPEEGIKLLLNAFRKYDPNDRYVAYIAYALSDHYRQLGDTEEEKKYLIISSIADIKSAVKEYVSLRRLATILYEEGDIERAYTYMRRSLDDAVFSNARLRTIETSQVLPVIDQAYQLERKKKQRQIVIALICISLLSVALIILFAYARRQVAKLKVAQAELSASNGELNNLTVRLKEINATLSKTNEMLSEANSIKEAYIVKFISECSNYIDKLDKYRTRLNKKAISGEMASLLNDLKQTTMVNDELKEFHASFDETFLKLFPSFIERFNALMPESEQIEIKQPGHLNKMLRIFALYRLGIKDNEQIAAFLRCSMATIYAYRSRTRSKALDPEHFEENVMSISSI